MAPRDPDLHRAISLRPRPTYHHNGTEPPPDHDFDLDLEGQTPPGYDDDAANDPYSLRAGLKSSDEIATIRANTSRKRRSSGRGSRRCFDGGGSEGEADDARSLAAKGKDAFKAQAMRAFYDKQNGSIERMLKPVDEHVRSAKERQDADALQYRIAVTGSFVANLALAGLQIYGAVSSGSLSLFTTMADAVFDPLSNLTLILSNRAVNRVDPRRYPSGKARIETAGNIAFCFLMTSVSFILIVTSIMALVRGNGGQPTADFHLPSVIAVAVAFCTKLGLFAYCYALRNTYSQIRILWEDHRNDLLINGPGLMTSVLGSRVRWWIDPLGAILLSLLIAFLWLRTAYSEFQLLIGVTADTPTLQHITYISMTHSPLILSLDTVRAWHSGPRLIVEVDVVMDRQQTVKESHDVAESLQTKIESLPDIERAYVHIDYETSHAPEHFWKKEL